MIARSKDTVPAPPDARPRRLRLAWVMAGAALGVLLTVIAYFVWLAVSDGPSAPALTEEALDEAEELWDSSGPASYNLNVVLGGRQSGEIHVEVREGEVTRMTRDGITPKQRRTWDIWAVPGMFEMITTDLENCADDERAAATFRVSTASEVVQRCRFDPKYGYPRKYQCLVLGGVGSLEWEVTQFEVVK